MCFGYSQSANTTEAVTATKSKNAAIFSIVLNRKSNGSSCASHVMCWLHLKFRCEMRSETQKEESDGEESNAFDRFVNFCDRYLREIGVS